MIHTQFESISPLEMSLRELWSAPNHCTEEKMMRGSFLSIRALAGAIQLVYLQDYGKSQAVQLKHVFSCLSGNTTFMTISIGHDDSAVDFHFNFGEFQVLNNPKLSTCEFKEAARDLSDGLPEIHTTALPEDPQLTVWSKKKGSLDFGGYTIRSWLT